MWLGAGCSEVVSIMWYGMKLSRNGKASEWTPYFFLGPSVLLDSRSGQNPWATPPASCKSTARPSDETFARSHRLVKPACRLACAPVFMNKKMEWMLLFIVWAPCTPWSRQSTAAHNRSQDVLELSICQPPEVCACIHTCMKLMHNTARILDLLHAM